MNKLEKIDIVGKFLDIIYRFLTELQKLPKWRLYIVFVMLGEKATNELLKIKEL